MKTVSLSIRQCSLTLNACQQSIDALARAMSAAPLLEALEDLKGLSDRYGLGLTDERDLFRVEIALRTAGGAADHDILRILPSEGYIKLVAAVAMDCGGEAVVSHGWPILSVVGPKTTVAEGVASANATPEAAQDGEAAR
ncbi:MAG: hypothetical protein MK060_12940 [Blastomonas sp.]|uniref:hypothetical protein n=1 Tax=Blastomonas sp. TaxID=1909299 RepID=UPI00406A4E3E|nr:hypothetical protein [Blastomonas sp.]